MGQNQVFGGVCILDICWLEAPIAMFYGNLPEFGNKVKVGNNSPVKLWEKMTQPQENCNINFDYGFGKLNTYSFK